MRPQGLSADAPAIRAQRLALDISGPIRAQGVSAGAEYFLGQSEVKESALALKYFLGQSEPKDFSLALSESELRNYSPALAIRVSALFWGHVWIIIISQMGGPTHSWRNTPPETDVSQ